MIFVSTTDAVIYGPELHTGHYFSVCLAFPFETYYRDLIDVSKTKFAFATILYTPKSR